MKHQHPSAGNERKFVAAMALTPPAPDATAARRTRSRAGPDAAARFARKLHWSNPVPALSVAVAHSSGALWADAWGKSDLEFDVAACPDHRFRIGSVSKVLTATAAARLVSRGVLDLDSPISFWLPDLPAHHCDTTMRQLLTHRGGVRHYIPRDLDPSSPGGPLFMRSFPDNRAILDAFIADPLVAPPGTRINYSSFGFTLASLVMEAAARQPFVELVKAEIGQAFDLASLVEDDPLAITPSRATGYLSAAELRFLYPEPTSGPSLAGGWAKAPPINPAFSWAGAGFLMTASDTARFGAALPESPFTLISEAERCLLFTPLTEATGGMPSLGLAWRIDEDARGRRRWHHAGATPGGRASLVVYPEAGLAIAIASNVMTVPGDVLTPSSALADLFA